MLRKENKKQKIIVNNLNEELREEKKLIKKQLKTKNKTI